MASKKQDEIISEASSHTIKKFDLIDNYVSSWAPKLLNNNKCSKLVFIDCMCNSGEYVDKQNGKKVFGTPVRVAKTLASFAKLYPQKDIYLFFNDFNKQKIEHLSSLITMKIPNLHINLSVKDGNLLLKELVPQVTQRDTSYLVVYDPYEASIDWEALYPYINHWGEVIINHMLYDSTRAVKMAKNDKAVQKYENTYLADINDLLPYGSDKTAYEKRIEYIISRLRKNAKYYVASFPFFNSKNSLVYDLIHCTNSSIGFSLYKQVAWKTFGGKSSTMETHGSELQLAIDLDNGNIDIQSNDNCFYISDIAKYLHEKCVGEKDLPISILWDILKEHPVFPADGFRKEIKSELKKLYGATISKNTISFTSKD